MERKSQSVSLLKTQTEEKVAATLYENISEKNLQDYENRWRPELQKRATEDKDWDWAAMVAGKPPYENYKMGNANIRYYAIECEGMTQGLAMLNIEKVLSRHPEHQGKEIIYVEYLATAPWNRKPEPQLKLVGTIFLIQAILESEGISCEGRIGLHAKPHAVRFYENFGMECIVEKDAKEGNLPYFELVDRTVINQLLSRANVSNGGT